jgi:hypothetical protein
MKLKLLSIALTVGALCLSPTAALSATIVHKIDLPMPADSYFFDLSVMDIELPAFNVPGGTLRSASFQTDFNYSASLTYDATTSPSDDQWFISDHYFNMDLIYNYDGFSDPTEGISDQFLQIPFDNCCYVNAIAFTLNPGSSGTKIISGSKSLFGYTETATNLIGLSVLPRIYTSFSARHVAYVERLGDPGLQIIDIRQSQSAKMTITYDYSVPEASTWMLLIIGFGAVGQAMRFQRQALTSLHRERRQI